MKSYLAHDKKSYQVYGGGCIACLRWAFKFAESYPIKALEL